MSNYGKCTSCNSWVPKGETVCPHCGAAQGLGGVLKGITSLFGAKQSERRAGRLCVSCNKLVGMDDDVCSYCGAKQTALKGAVNQVSAALPSDLPVTTVLIGVLGILFVLPLIAMLDHPQFDLAQYFKSGLFEGVEDMDQPLLKLGINFGPLLGLGQYWRLVTATFLHFGLMHIAFNCYALYILGPMTEDLYGKHWFVFMYVLTGIAGNVLSYWAHGAFFLQAGASGSVFGLIGIGIVYCWRTGWRNRHILQTLVMWAGLSFLFGFFMRADNYAHLGGLVSGGALTWLIPPEKALTKNGRSVGKVLSRLTVVLVMMCFYFALTQPDNPFAQLG